MSVAASVIAQLLSQGPTLLVVLAGCVLAVIWRARQPQACVLLFCGCALYLVAAVGGTTLSMILFERMRSGELAAGSPLIGLCGFVAGALRAGGIALLIAAALSGRDARA